MNRRALAATGLGIFSIACASGAFAGPTDGTSVVESRAGDSELRLRGSVADRNGKRLANALIIADCSCLPEPRQTQSNANGLWGFQELPPGDYTVQVLFDGSRITQAVTLPEQGIITIRSRINPTESRVVT